MPVGTPAALLSATSVDEVHLVFPEQVHAELERVLFPANEEHPFFGKYERGAFCVVCRSTGLRRVSYVVRDVVHPRSGDDLAVPRRGWSGQEDAATKLTASRNSQLGRSGTDSDRFEAGLRFSKRYHHRAIQRAKELGGGLLRVHTHPGGVTPSDVDRRSARRIFDDDADRLPAGAPLLAAITNGDGAWSGRVYEFGRSAEPHVSPVSAVRIVGPRFRRVETPDSPSRPAGALGNFVGEAHESTIQLWGEEGQRILGGLRVGLVGCGGVGSILATQLPRLGVGELVLVDFDRLEQANANRAVGATVMDVRQSRLKTLVAQREAHRAATSPGFETTVVDGSVVEEDPTFAAVPSLLDCDVIVLAVDAARPRQVVDHLASAHCILAVSGGSRLHVDDGGRLLPEAKIQTSVTGPGFACFRCQRVWRLEDVEEEREHPRFRREQRYIEGGGEPSEPPRSPSVIGINSIVAGLLQHRLTALVLRIGARVVGTHRLGPRDLDTKWFAGSGSCNVDCDRPALAAGDLHRLPLGTDLTMRYYRDDIAMPETTTIDTSRADEILAGE